MPDGAEARRCADPRCLARGCGAPEAADFEVVATDTREGKGLWERCLRCGLVVNRGGVEAASATAFYNDEYLRTNSLVAGEILDPARRFEERVEAARAVAEVLRPHLAPSMRLLEIGAGAGELLHHLRDSVAYAFANEIHAASAAFIRERLGVDASSEDYLSLRFDRPFDAVVSIDTLDHLDRPGLFVEKMRRDLAPGGLLYVEVPNDEQALARDLPEPSRKAFRRFMYQRAHCYSFTRATLRRLVEERGFRVEWEVCRHTYSLENFLRWLLTGAPQATYRGAAAGGALCAGDSPFAREMNALLVEADVRFREVITRTGAGETVGLLARRADG